MTFFDYWKAFHSVLKECTLPATAQLVGYKLLAEFNGAKFPAAMTLSDRELQRLTNIKSLKSIHDAKALLKELNLIDFTNRKKQATVYRLLEVNTEVNTKQTPSKHEVNTDSASLIRAGEDISDGKDVTDFNEEEEERGREYKVSPQVLKAWEEYANEKASLGARRELHELENFAGIDAVAKAIRAVWNKFNRVNMELVRGNLYGKGRNSKVGEYNARNVIDFRDTASDDFSWVDKHPNRG